MIEPGALTPTMVGLLVAAAFAAGVVDAIAGGGGLLTVPALFATGLPPHLALGTNKGQAAFGAASALLRYAREGLLDRTLAPQSFLAGFAGSAVGVTAALYLSPGLLKGVVLLLLPTVALWLLLRRPVAGGEDLPLDAGQRRRLAGGSLVLGGYDGFFGPGTGTLLIGLFASAGGRSLRRASADAKAVNLGSNLAALLGFLWAGQVVWAVALPMALAQALGAQLGARMTLRGGDVLVRRLVVLVVVGLVARLSFDLFRQ